ncbi:hypothetical protein L6452_20199 [Arctium lappa]|uniref:Uncharacterized protein n=1 Tax=Arctium lappa TaxID=4217 RepID=A0ACB9BBJ1_ARCLA|nr:hypothetical protein L6452_20199 [Arctium lappa]
MLIMASTVFSTTNYFQFQCIFSSSILYLLGVRINQDYFNGCLFWTESFVQWSPLGTYLATVHRQGAAVWGGTSTFNRLMCYAYAQVKLIDFSPGEKYLVTYSSHEPSTPHDSHRVLLNIFDVRTDKVMRDFKGNADEFAFGGTGGFTGVSWPVFRNWSGPSVATMCDASIYIRGWSGIVCVVEPHSDFATVVPGDSIDLDPGI